MNLCDKVISLHPVIQETVYCWDWSDKAKAHAIRLMEFLFWELKAEEHREDYPKKLLWLMEASQKSFEKHPRLKNGLTVSPRAKVILGKQFVSGMNAAKIGGLLTIRRLPSMSSCLRAS